MNDLKNAQNMVSVDPMQDGENIASPFKFVTVTVGNDWLDYNGHMNECMYLFVASLGYEGFAKYIGLTPEWVKQYGSYFTVENHNVYVNECKLGDELYTTTQVIDADEKRLHLLNQVYRSLDDTLVFTSENLNVYVNPISRRVEAVPSEIGKKIKSILDAHKDIDKSYCGRTIGIRHK